MGKARHEPRYLLLALVFLPQVFTAWYFARVHQRGGIHVQHVLAAKLDMEEVNCERFLQKSGFSELTWPQLEYLIDMAPHERLPLCLRLVIGPGPDQSALEHWELLRETEEELYIVAGEHATEYAVDHEE